MFIHTQTIRRILIFVSLLLPLSLSWSTDTRYSLTPGLNDGAKYFRNYSRKNYNSQPQNWFITQDKRGFIYSANQGAVLEYDGISWREILIPGKNARSLAVDRDGTIFVGGNNEIGYLKPGHNDLLQYTSLSHLLETQHRSFGYVWRVYATQQGIFFCATKYLFLFSPGNINRISTINTSNTTNNKSNSRFIKVWQSETSFSPPFLCSGKLYVRQQGQGLMEMRNGRFSLLSGGETFAFESIYAIVEFTPGTLLIGTLSKGFFLYKNGSFVPFKTPVLERIAGNQLTHGIRLTDGHVALATQKGGIFIIDTLGQLKLRFDTSMGLLDNTVWHICEDTGKNLWLALNNGIAKLEYQSPFSSYDQRHGLKGMVFSVARFGGSGDFHDRLYVGTVSGLFFMSPKGTFQPVPGIPGTCHALLSHGDSLLAATDKGVFLVTGKNNTAQMLDDTPAYMFHVTGREGSPILAGTNHGLVSFFINAETRQWHSEKFHDEINAEIRTMAHDSQGNLWLASPREGVIKISFSSSPRQPSASVVHRYSLSWFPPGVAPQVFYAAGHIIIATGKGIFRWDEKIARFVPDLTFGASFAGGENGTSVLLIAEDANKHIWLHSNARNMVATPLSDGSYRIDYKEFLRIPLNHVNSIYPDPLEPLVWFASTDALIMFDTRADLEPLPPFRTFIRGVWANGLLVLASDTKPGKNQRPELPFKRRSFRFAFAAPFFEAEQDTRYQCRLEGYDLDWTSWSSETRKDYTNLEPGKNVFRVRAKNIYGQISEEAVFRFNLLFPWYRTWWAYLVYILVALLIFSLLVRWRSSALRLEKQQLETIVAERTREINCKNEQLQEMAKIKSNFFANISHEFRTPLTLILGPLEQMIASASDSQQQKKLKLMRRNAQRLLNLINQLLELSKFDSGAVTLKVSLRDIVSFTKGLIASFELLTTRNDQQLTFGASVAEIIVYFDEIRFEEILGNLLINAIKFTPVGGSISVSLAQQPLAAHGFPQGYVELTVNDTGPGIPPEQLEKIFDRFYYSDNIYEYNQKGAGIGLAIAKELVELHHGTIAVESKQGEQSGSRFTLRIPLGTKLLKYYEGVSITPSSEPSTVPAQISSVLMLEGELSRDDKKSDDIESDSRELDDLELNDLALNGLALNGLALNGLESDRKKNVSEPFSGEQEIILVVEDSVDVCQYIRSALEPHYKVIDAHDGQDGIEKAFQIIPDLIVSDVMMPRADGYQLCKVLKLDRSTSHIPIILLTAKASEENILEGLETGADDYITKPFSTRILSARIKNLIDVRRQMQQSHRLEMALAPVKSHVSSLDREFFKDLHRVIESNLSDSEFNVELLAKKLYMGRSTVYRKIEALCGENPSDYIRSYRLKRAAQLLQLGTASITEVAFDVGFNSRTYFTRCFKEMFHQLPSDFKKNT